MKLQLEEIIRDLGKAKALIAALGEQYNSHSSLTDEDNALAHIAIEDMIIGVLDRLKGLAEIG